MNVSPRFGAAFALPFEIAAFLLAGLVIGNWVDGRYHTGPWGLIFGLVLGLAGTLQAVIRVSRAAERAEEREREARGKDDPGASE